MPASRSFAASFEHREPCCEHRSQRGGEQAGDGAGGFVAPRRDSGARPSGGGGSTHSQATKRHFRGHIAAEEHKKANDSPTNAASRKGEEGGKWTPARIVRAAESSNPPVVCQTRHACRRPDSIWRRLARPPGSLMGGNNLNEKAPTAKWHAAAVVAACTRACTSARLSATRDVGGTCAPATPLRLQGSSARGDGKTSATNLRRCSFNPFQASTNVNRVFPGDLTLPMYGTTVGTDRRRKCTRGLPKLRSQHRPPCTPRPLDAHAFQPGGMRRPPGCQ